MTENRARNLGILALGMLLQSIALTAMSAPKFSVTPYLQHPATNAMTILFFTTENCEATVKWWRADGKGETFEKPLTGGTDVSDVLAKNSQASSSGSDKDYVAFSKQYKYRVRIDTLRTYTDYEYEVSLAGGPTYRNRFRTFPDRNTPIRFVGYSDSETVPEADADTVTWITHQGSKTYPVKRRQGYATNLVHMVSRQPDVITISGDLAAKGGWQKNWDEFWKQNAGEYGDPAGSIPILAAIGNHDLKDKSSSISGSTGGESALEKYLTYFEYNTNGVKYTYIDGTEKEPETRDLSQLFHREDLGPVTLIFLDTNKGAKGSDKKYTTQTNSDRPPMRSPDFNPGSLQYAWLTNNLADAQRKSRFTFVFNHHCPYSSGKHNSTSDSECAQAVRNLTSAMIKYGVDGWLCGHDEVQEHSQTNGWETLPNGKKRAHTLNIFALGSGGDSVKHSGEDSDSVANPISVFRAYKDDPDTWTSDNKTLLSGGVHYGHIEVDVTTNKNGQWMCSLTPVYSFVSVDAKTFKRCCYSDRVILQELPIDETSSKEIVYQQAPRFAYGSIPENYVEYERPPQMADPVDPPEPPEPTEDGVLRISEICPKPQMACKTDSSKLTDATDPNGVVAGWIELENRGTGSVDLGAYKLVVANRGKKLKTDEFSNLPTKTLAAGARVVIYTTKDYSADGDLMFKQSFMNENETRAFVKGEAAGITADEIVLATKVNPKKFPMVRLLKGSDVVDSVIVPADLPDNASVVVQDPGTDGATLRYLTTHPTCGTANDLTDAVKLGPNVGPLYGVKHSFSDLDPVPPATSGQDYEIALDVNPVDAANAKDAIKSVTLVYRTHANAVTSTCQRVTMTSNSWDTAHGITWKATVPKDKLPAKGMLLQWKAEIVDAAGNTWTSPAFNGKEAGYEWYGTIVDPGVGNDDGQNSETIPTWHMFVIAGDSSYPMTDKPTGKTGALKDGCLMNLDYDETYEYPASKDTTKKKAYRQRYPYGARCAIYDAQTSNYYDNVRIDCRGNSSDDYYKRSHGLKFSKIKAYRLATPYVHPVSGEEVEEIAKTSLCAEYNDPAQFRQRLAFWFMNTVGVYAPWENPKRVNLNGKFYQFAYESPRFTDELLSDVYGFDARGSGYKNVGTFHTGTGTDDYGYDMGTTATAGTKKKTPDDGNEKDFSELTAFFDEIKAAGNVKTSKDGSDKTGLDNATLTATVVEKFDLAAWINYLAATRITQEGDDVWGNLAAYYDNYTLIDGTVCGTGTWRPLAWDMNCSWGQYYYVHLSGQTRAGLHANKDWNKCHPFYGGMRILAYQQPGATSSFYAGSKGANYAIESVFQSTKFRRLFLRRLRTLMDTYLKETGTDMDATPIAVQMQAYANEVLAESRKDRKLWGYLGTSDNADCSWVNCWGSTLMSTGGYQPDDPQYGVTDIWENYIGPRRTHLFTTHAASGGSSTGYGLNVCAGIPAKQSAMASLREKITVQYDANLGAVVIKNTNAETIDVSGWKLTGPLEMTLPPGTVLDQGSDATPGEVYVAADRRATIAKMTLKDQVVVGNGVTNAATTVRLADATGEPVVPYTVVVTTAADGNGTVTAGGEYEVGANVTLTATPATGYRFTKWTMDDASESKDNPLVLSDLRRSVSATATFKANEYTVAYDANGGEGEIAEGAATYDKKYETADCTFVKTGYTCTGWGTNGVGGLVFVCKPGKKVQNLSAENKAKVTLHAMWEPIGYSLVYAPGEATGLAETNTLSYDEAHTVSECPFVREGYAFTGWGDGGEALRQPGEIVSNLTTTAGAVVIWTAEWEALSPVPAGEPESIKEIALGVDETIAITNTYRRNLRFWLFGSTRQSKVVEAELNLPYQDCGRYVGYANRTTVKTNEVVVTLRGVAKGEETVSFGRQYKMKDPVHAVSYRITVK